MAAENTGVIKAIMNESSDIGMVAAVIAILLAMILPVPTLILDFLLALSITLSVIVLITTMYTEKPLDFAIFPTMLLFLTLFRLSLNVASTRLILLHGNEGPDAAGDIIKSFGAFVVGGNYTVGLIIFVILVIINFMVITKGAGRIAEVAARFTLDAMPGKQMAIDADLNAGMIDENEARARRKEVANESEFHGAMDGASKFVRGDAVAGIIITLINVIGGIIIGVSNGLDMATAASNYTLLSVGDGLVSQIPALIISTASGVLVSRAGSGERMGKEFSNHIFKRPAPIYMGSVIVFFLGLVPGLPAIPFMFLAAALSGSVYYFSKDKAEEKALLPGAPGHKEEAAEPSGPEEVDHLLSMDVMELEVGYGIIPLVDKSQDGSLLARIKSIRRQFASDLGMVVPPIHIRDNLKLRPSEYRFIIKGVEMAKSELMVNHLLAMDPGDVARPIDGIPTREPAFNLPAIWIPPEREEEARFAGYTVVDNSTVVATHLTEIIKSNASDLLGRQEVQHLIENVAKSSPKAVEELVPNLMSIGMVQKVLQNLLSERISIRDMLTIVETLADYATMTKDPDLLTEYVRQKMSRSILAPYVQPDGVISVITMDRKVEDILTKSLQHTDHGTYMSIDPNVAEKIILATKTATEKAMDMNVQPIVLTPPGVRRHLRRMVEHFLPAVIVTSHAEIMPSISLRAVAKIEI
ncbi:flagellar biosynthesis protein FlhA [Desulforegula conservatrix]|uniref:flagellar biosynthesis protein FlhA n=1 Tax=Desulforegula conservatrix TaxID=153026 RepID=UPI00041F1F8D|nr:flagellar biosynthesis protein FlhA [Desulforegula conservatrix]